MKTRWNIILLAALLLTPACAPSQCYDCYIGGRESALLGAQQGGRYFGEAVGRGDLNGRNSIRPFYILRPIYDGWLRSLLGV